MKWVDGRLSVRFPLRRGADLSAVLAELAAQLGGGGGRAPETPGAPPGPDPGYPALEGEVVTKACLELPQTLFVPNAMCEAGLCCRV